jgi:hypothetical protein
MPASLFSLNYGSLIVSFVNEIYTVEQHFPISFLSNFVSSSIVAHISTRFSYAARVLHVATYMTADDANKLTRINNSLVQKEIFIAVVNRKNDLK